MTTYLGEKAVGVGTVKANMNVGKVITDEKTILGDGFTEQLAVNTLLFATSESVAASAEAVRTEFDGKLKAVEADIDANADAILRTRELYEAADTQIRAEITNVEDRVRELTKSTVGEFVDVKLDVSDLKDANQNIRTEIAGKQDKLTAGENITIEDGVISATGGGGELPDNVLVNTATGENSLAIGGTATGVHSVVVGYGATAIRESVAQGANANAYSGGVAIGYNASTGKSAAATPQIAIGRNAKVDCIGTAIQLGNGTNSDPNTFKVANGNGNFEIMSADGTIPLERLTKVTDQIGDISTALTAILGE